MTTHMTIRRSRSRSGVGVIIGGVIVFSIILSTVLLFILSVTDNQRAKTGFEILAAQANQDKSAEDLTALRENDLLVDPPGYPAGSYIDTTAVNEGSLPLVVSHTALYCLSAAGCPSPNDPVIGSPSITLNSKETAAAPIGPVSDALSYRVDYITERGNIVSTSECLVDLAALVCVDTGGNPSGPYFEISADPNLLVMEPGNTDTSTITVTSFNGFNSPVDLEVFFPADFSGGILPAQVTPPADLSIDSTLTVSPDASVSEGTYVVVVRGTSGTIIRTTSVAVSIFSITGALNEGIVQGTGSLQLDFRAFGSIYPKLGTRDGIDQRGWEVSTPSSYGSVTGYPGFEIPYRADVFFVERVRNLDPSGEDITLTRKTALITNQGSVPSGQQSVVYLCKETGDPSTGDGIEAYNETSAAKTLTSVPINAAQTVGWNEVYFCSEDPGVDYNLGGATICGGGSNTGFCPEHTNDQLNGIIMVARGVFTTTLSQYGQTIPYQSAQPGTTAIADFFWCLYGSNVNPASTCPDPDDSSSGAQDTTLVYTANQATMQSGLTLYAHHGDNSLPTPPATITWIYPNGKTAVLANGQNLNGNQNIQIDLPQTYDDGSAYDCGGNSEEYFIIKLNDDYSSTGTRNVYYTTFRMTCP